MNPFERRNNSGDWFNKLDFTYKTNNWGVGAPVAEKNLHDWDFWKPRLAETTLTPSSDDILATLDYFRMLLQIRAGSALYRLQTADNIIKRVSFLNAEAGIEQVPGLVIMAISDAISDMADLDDNLEMIVVAFNATTMELNFAHHTLATTLSLDSMLASSTNLETERVSCGTGDGQITLPPRRTVIRHQEATD